MIVPGAQKLISLQACRALAAIMVVLYHVTVYLDEHFQTRFLNGFFTFGFTGVDFFFVLSGFIIFYAHQSDVGNPSRLRSYVIKRLIRIFPIYWAITSVKLVAILVVPGYAKDYELQIGTIVKSIVLFPQENLPLVAAAWTLSHELLFYALFGLVIAYGARFAGVLLGVWGTAIIALNAYLLIAGNTAIQVHYLLQFVLYGRNLEFVLGCASAAVVARRVVPRPRLWLLGGTFLFVVGGLVVDLGINASTVFLTLVFGSASFLIVTGLSTLERFGRVRVPRLLVFCGDASYSMYLLAFAFVNVVAIPISRAHLDRFLNPTELGIGLSLVAITGGLIIYVTVERRLLKKSRELFQRSGARSLGIAIPPRIQLGDSPLG